MTFARHREFTVKAAFGVMVLIVAANALFVGSLAVPSSHRLLCKRINSAIATDALRPSVNRDLLDTDRGVENYVDCLVLQAAVDENRWQNAISSRVVGEDIWASPRTITRPHDTPDKLETRNRAPMTMCQVLQDLCSNAPTTSLEYHPYHRYWLGTRVTSEVALSLFEMRTVRSIYKALHYLAFLLPLVLAARRSIRLFVAIAPISLYGIFFSAIPLFGQQLSYGPPFIFAIVGPTIVASMGTKYGSRNSLLYFAAASGCIAAFLDLFNALLLHASLLFWLVYEFEVARQPTARGFGLRRAALALATWIFAVISTVAIKQILAAVVFGSSEVFAEFYGQLMFRLGATTDQAEFGVARSGFVTFAKLFEGLPMIAHGSQRLAHALVALAVFSWLFATIAAMGALVHRACLAWAWDWVAAICATGILAAWYLALPNHTQIHAYVMGRPLFFPLALGWSLCACIAYDRIRGSPANAAGLRASDDKSSLPSTALSRGS